LTSIIHEGFVHKFDIFQTDIGQICKENCEEVERDIEDEKKKEDGRDDLAFPK
jgi:hypothetical protein